MTPGWAVSLSGDALDLDEFRETLKPPFDPCVEDYVNGSDARLVLRSIGWASLPSAGDVLWDARRIVEMLNGEAFLFHADAQPVSCEAVMEFDQSGMLLASTHVIGLKLTAGVGRFRARATAVTSGPPPQPRPSAMQRWYRDAATVTMKAELFASLSRMDSWYNLYKAMEIMRRLKGGSVKWKQTLSGDFGDWDRVWQHANSHRHAPDPSKPPLRTPVPTFEEAKGIISSLIRKHL